MRWAIGTPFVDGTHWLAMVGIMRSDNELSFHLGFFWVLLSWA